ncbi:hypothetical protein [Bradyrhizobium sp. 6(2017)]|uniref:hypothetical protein n=1 Tax=Bradyrhizobium sp. 6(2017) TaxID=1197460 RepID=UPI0013E115AB|nr:hypothetical protein [Bradyrhizobium sp. 6(2017)]QIG92281.1 hypothetical protein G6P99_07040 [Bradyrhizobium sp. 6(2017)]
MSSNSIQERRQRLATKFAARRRELELKEIKTGVRASRPGDVKVSLKLAEKIERVERLGYRVSVDELEAIVSELKAEQSRRIRPSSQTRH